MTYTANRVVFDIADNHGSADHVSIRAIDFYSGGVKIPMERVTDFDGYGTTYYYEDHTYPHQAFETAKSKTGDWADTAWASHLAYNTNQRLVIAFVDIISFDEIRINNGHNSGIATTTGAKNVVIQATIDGSSGTVYGETVENATLLFDGQFRQHVASDVEDEETLSLIVELSSSNITCPEPVVSPPTLSGPPDVYLTDSIYITSSGTATTTAQLTAPTAKTTGDFQAGHISDDTNPVPAIDLAANKYTEIEFSIEIASILPDSDEVEFRLTDSGVVLDTYSYIPKITADASDLEQFGFRFYQDDAVMTPLAANNTDITLAPDTNFILRTGIDAEGDPPPKNFQLEYRRKPSGGVFADWVKVS